ncbi:GHMP family kinase ATP-binding protein [Vagococcus hydrophili]|uniref:GHMP kinase N-terminal domain-containing protein n=1 Tax=Vagococcus hydrophili TaxID=2714947 RepID=A0A6G8AUH3_9ENTE|nr:hypothetical protein [Vagococcus hydrophili]QIL48637.1 hypothetical protein G7082_09040 [Vagococcus hydrophili]
MEKITVSCSGSCGELIQGYVDDVPYLVSCGIKLFSYVTISEEGSQKSQIGKKAIKASRLVEDYLNIPKEKQRRLKIAIQSELTKSKGMASSTADIAATIYGTALFYGIDLAKKEIAYLCVQIEPTDSVFFDSMTLLDLKKGRVMDISQWFPDFLVLMLEPNKGINTQKHHTSKNELLAKEQSLQFREVYQTYYEAVKEKELARLGEAATKSACLNQEILPKPYFKEILLVKKKFDSVFGVNVAHSGTVVGILLKNLSEIEAIKEELTKLGVTRFYKKIGVHQSYFEGLQQVEDMEK